MSPCRHLPQKDFADPAEAVAAVRKPDQSSAVFRLARFLPEVSTAQATVLTAFDWGAASRLPFLPKVRYGRLQLTTRR